MRDPTCSVSSAQQPHVISASTLPRTKNRSVAGVSYKPVAPKPAARLDSTTTAKDWNVAELSASTSS
jgi:hypothetical protein